MSVARKGHVLLRHSLCVSPFFIYIGGRGREGGGEGGAERLHDKHQDLQSSPVNKNCTEKEDQQSNDIAVNWN